MSHNGHRNDHLRIQDGANNLKIENFLNKSHGKISELTVYDNCLWSMFIKYLMYRHIIS